MPVMKQLFPVLLAHLARVLSLRPAIVERCRIERHNAQDRLAMLLHGHRIRLKDVSPFLAARSVSLLDCTGGNTRGYELTVQIQHQYTFQKERRADKRGWSGSN